ncbi:MAG TPA: hypothetical protein VFB59_04320 [Candidatus Saccharimonadales bacterium]|nr:hypothetical protein [Candidatus Saccharimonadales bacterium]
MTSFEDVPTRAENDRSVVVRELMKLCLEATVELPFEDVIANEDGSSTVRTWVLDRNQARIVNYEPTWLATTLLAEKSCLAVSALGRGRFDNNPEVTLTMQPDGQVSTEATGDQIADYTVILALRLGKIPPEALLPESLL